MQKNAKKDMLFLVLAGIVLITVNVVVLFAANSGKLAPISNMPLWTGFVVLNTLSLLWAVSLLGLQPMVVALSYMVGGFLAYQGVKLLPGANIAELTTTGATYGAFGAMVIGNATTKVRMAFFYKKQIPFVFVILALLAMDAFLNSFVSNPDWSVVLNALVFPFILAGGIIGLIWLVLLRVGIGHPVVRASAAVSTGTQSLNEESDENAMQLMIKIPDHIEVDDEPEPITLAMETTEPPNKQEPMVMTVAPSEQLASSDDRANDHFFPLDIDKDEDFILPGPDSTFMEELAVIEEHPVPAFIEAEPIQMAEETPPIPEPVLAEVVQKAEKKSSDDWLSGHLDLLNRIKQETK